MDPVGELEELIRRAFAEGPETLDATTAATFLAQALAPNVVMRDQLQHLGWYFPGRPDQRMFTPEEITEVNEGERAIYSPLIPVFSIPARVVVGTAHHVLAGTMGADA